MATVFFPINPTLGPILYRFKKMMTQDFYTFARLATPFIVSLVFFPPTLLRRTFGPVTGQSWCLYY